MQFKNLAELYQYFDELAEQDAESDVLFSSSYIRGFIGLSASKFGDEQQPLSLALAEDVSESLQQSRAELTPSDRELVKQYWQEMLIHFS